MSLLYMHPQELHAHGQRAVGTGGNQEISRLDKWTNNCGGSTALSTVIRVKGQPSPMTVIPSFFGTGCKYSQWYSHTRIEAQVCSRQCVSMIYSHLLYNRKDEGSATTKALIRAIQIIQVPPGSPFHSYNNTVSALNLFHQNNDNENTFQKNR